MDTLEIVQSIFYDSPVPIFSIIAIILSIISIFLSFRFQKFSKRAKYEENRPRITFPSIILEPKKVKFYCDEANEEFESEQTFPISEISSHIQKTERMNKRWVYDGKEYMLINTCPIPKSLDEENSLNDVIVALDVLELRLKFDSDRFSDMEIIEAFSVSPRGESFGNDITLNTKFPVYGKTLEIPIAYVSIIGEATSLHLGAIHKRVVSKDRLPINFLRSRLGAGHFVGFGSTAYLFKCETIDNEVYEYTALLKIEDKNLVAFKIHGGRKLFDKATKDASKCKMLWMAKRKIVQYAIKDKKKK